MACIMGAEPDQIIHRYMDLSKLLDLLLNKKLFFTKIAAFSDKLEGSISDIDYLALGDWGEMSDVAMNLSWPPVDETPEQREERRHLAAQAEEKIKRKRYSTVFGEFAAERPEGRLDLRALINKQKEWLYASCWHIEESESESIAMWKIYGGVDTGVCVISSVADILAALKPADGNEVVASKVAYVPPKDSLSLVLGERHHQLSAFSWKHPFYSPERELRFICYNKRSDIFSSVETPAGVGLNIALRQAIREIRLSPEAPHWCLAVLDRLVNEEMKLDIPVRQSGMHGLT